MCGQFDNLRGIWCDLRAVELLKRYYQGELTGLDDEDDEDAEGEEDEERTRKGKKGDKKMDKKKRSRDDDEDDDDENDDHGGSESKLLTETLAPRTNMPPLLVNLAERKPERLHYLGVECAVGGDWLLRREDHAIIWRMRREGHAII